MKLRDLPALPVALGVWLASRLLPATHEVLTARALAGRLPRLKIRRHFVDIRPSAAFDAGHLPGALSLPLDAPDAAGRARRLRRSRRLNDGLVFVYGARGDHLSDAEALLRRAGFRNVRYIMGGYEALREEGLG